MQETKADTKLIAKCGLYCGACGRYKKGKCKGCMENEKASWCKVRICCLDKEIDSCADCNEYSNVMACGKYNNFMAKLFGVMFNSDRAACIQKIKQEGYHSYASQMEQNGMMTIKRKNRFF